MTPHLIFGTIAGAMSFAGFLLYIAATLRGQTKPNRATWWVLTLVGVVIASSYFAEGARATIWIPLSYIAGLLIVALLSLKYGDGAWESLDRYCLAAALVSAVVWAVFDTPFLTLAINILMDFVALVPTIKKSWLRPEGEDLAAWWLETCACAVNLLAVEQVSWSVAFYPWYLFVVNCGIALLLLRGTKSSSR